MTETVPDVTTLGSIIDLTTTGIAATVHDDSNLPTTNPWTTESAFNVSIVQDNEETECIVFKVFNVLEILMTFAELAVWMAAAFKMQRWRKNYRNQMLMQISVARFVKRIIFSLIFLHIPAETDLDINSIVLKSLEMYVDFVLVILVFFFIKHMYDSLIIVLVKIRQNSLYKVSLCSWLVPVPISVAGTLIISFEVWSPKIVYLIICCIFRWPLIFLGTGVYITILCRVLFDKIRRFAFSLTAVTFFMCLFINIYLISKDVIVLFCIDTFGTMLISYISGFVMNLSIVTFYIILIILDYKHCNQTAKVIDTIPNYSLADATCKINLNEEF